MENELIWHRLFSTLHKKVVKNCKNRRMEFIMKKILAIILVAIMALSAAACVTDPPAVTTDAPSSESSEASTPGAGTTDAPGTDAPTDPPATASPKEDALKNGLAIVNEGKALFTIVPPANETDVYIKQAVDKIANAVKYQSGTALAKGAAEQEYEILIGDTGRKESTELKATLGADQYAVKLVGKKLVVVASEDIFLYDALAKFTGTYFTPEHSYAEDGDCLILTATNIDIKENADKTSIRYLLSQSAELYSSSNKNCTVTAPSPTTGVQGGCTDGKYYYQGFIQRIDEVEGAKDEKKNKCVIIKFNMKTGNAIKKSKVLDLNHTNDITYLPKTNELVVAHNNPYRTKLTILDADTLKVKTSVEIMDKIYSITYAPEKDMYCVGLSGGQNLRFYKSDFTRLNSTYVPATQITKNYTTQGICSDDNYIYCVLWDSAGYTAGNPVDNVITVYDWYGNYVGIIHISIGRVEPENISISNGTLYVIGASGGASLYEIKNIRTTK